MTSKTYTRPLSYEVSEPRELTLQEPAMVSGASGTTTYTKLEDGTLIKSDYMEAAAEVS